MPWQLSCHGMCKFVADQTTRTRTRAKIIFARFWLRACKPFVKWALGCCYCGSVAINHWLCDISTQKTCRIDRLDLCHHNGVTRPQWVKLGGAETGIFQESWDTTIAADALAPCVTNSVGNSHRSASPRPTTLEEDRKLFVKFSLILCLWFEIQGLRTYNFFHWISNTGHQVIISHDINYVW